MRRLRAVGLVVTIVTALLGATMVPAQAAPTWTRMSDYYSLTTNYTALNRCVVVKEFGNVVYETTKYRSVDLSTMVRKIRNPRVIGPTTVVQFYDKCGAGRVKKALPAARIELKTAWMDNKKRFEGSNALSVNLPWGVTFTPSSASYGYHWGRRSFTSNTVRTAQFTITSSGTAASWKHEQVTQEPYYGPTVYPKIKMTNELHSFVIHSRDRTHSFAADKLPKKSFYIW